MRWSLVSSLAALSLSVLALASPSPNVLPRAAGKEASFEAVEKDSWGKPIKPSEFNGKTVPFMKELDGEVFPDTIKKGYWMVEFFSPYCPHCEGFAPTLQTLYELYYTSKPVTTAKDDDSSVTFTKFYNFRFGKLNCMAFGTQCANNGVKSFPTVMLFKDGEKVTDSVGAKDLKDMVEWMEGVLETIEPGSRPKGGLRVPAVGADHTSESDPVVGDSAEGTKEKTTGDKEKVTGNKEKILESEKEEKPKKKTQTGSAKKPSASKSSAKIKFNPEGRSVDLTAETFLAKVTSTRDPWFIKFYAPWCPHCQALAPTWKAVARDMKGKINVGEVNCDVEKRLCKDVKIRGFPTLLYFKGGERIEHTGLRGLGDLLNFANKAIAASEGVKDVTAEELEELEKTEEVIFVYVYDHATTSEDFAALERLTLSLIGKARIVKTKDKKLYARYKISTWPRLLVTRDGKPTYYTALAPKDMRDARRVLDWMRGVWRPIVAELTAASAQEIMSNKLVVLGILSRQRADEFLIAKREIKNAALEWIDKQTQAFQLERQELRDAKQLRIEEAEDRNDQRALRNAKSIRINMEDIERKEVAFAWVDGVFWERWIKTTYGISVKDGEKVVIIDEENHRYWDSTSTGNPIVPSRTSILETLPKIVANPPKLAAKSTASFLGHIYYSLRNAFARHPVLSSGALAILLVVLLVWYRGARRGAGGGGSGGNGSLNGAIGGNGVFGEKKGWGRDTGGFFQLPVNEKGNGTLGGLLGGGGREEKAD